MMKLGYYTGEKSFINIRSWSGVILDSLSHSQFALAIQSQSHGGFRSEGIHQWYAIAYPIAIFEYSSDMSGRVALLRDRSVSRSTNAFNIEIMLSRCKVKLWNPKIVPLSPERNTRTSLLYIIGWIPLSGFLRMTLTKEMLCPIHLFNILHCLLSVETDCFMSSVKFMVPQTVVVRLMSYRHCRILKTKRRQILVSTSMGCQNLKRTSFVIGNHVICWKGSQKWLIQWSSR